MKKISILMGLYNCADTIDEAIQSILAQTYTNWQLILCDDGSTDSTYQKAYDYFLQDNRIELIKNETNVGLNLTLNRCLAIATGEYIARMDGDDVCVPERFEKQVAFLETHPEYAIVSSGMFLFDECEIWGKVLNKEYPQPRDVVEGSSICHAPVMMRKECMDKVGGYTVDKRRLRVEDVDLWIKLYASGYRCYNIQELLYGMRNDQEALNRRKYIYRINSTYVRLQGCKLMGLGLSSKLKAFTPMIVGLVPAQVRKMIRRIQGKKAYG